MKTWLVRLSLGIGGALALLVIAFAWLASRQGLSDGDLRALPAEVRFDEHGVPTLEGKSWEALVEAQGYLVASQRFFQMDLSRRAAAGRLAELFGDRALRHDVSRREQDWLGYAERGYDALPETERRLVDAYARGVNAFLDAHPRTAGLEYLLLRSTPEPWQGRDTLLVLLQMCEQLASSADDDALRWRWRQALGERWFGLLFPDEHPWNQPLFGEASGRPLALPLDDALPMAPIAPEELSWVQPREAPRGGASNSWAWCRGERCFLANDPHLGASVPQIWYALRLRLAEDAWAVGVAIPGIPGLVLGMNPHLAWAFTNVGEDVDDYLEERLSEDGSKYLLAVRDGEEVWAPVEERPSLVLVKGGEPVEVVARFTARGPLVEPEHLPGRRWARRWLPFEPGRLSLPTALSFARGWEELNGALDRFLVPAQNVLMADRAGRIGYRASGSTILRRVSGRFPQPALEGDWLGIGPSASRPRLLYYPVTSTAAVGRQPGAVPFEAEASRFLATANERIGSGDFGHQWTEDLRKERIRRFLSEPRSFNREDMRALQLDTESRFHRLLVRWVAEHARAEGDEAEATLARWRQWDGVAARSGVPLADEAARRDAASFTDALRMEEKLMALAVGRVRRHRMTAVDADLPYRARMDSAWVIRVLEADDGVRVFGFEAADLADHLLETALAGGPPYHELNRWRAQHPLAQVPVLGALFAVREPEQRGHIAVPRVEAPRYGASVRVVWDLAEPLESSWSFPVGQSGHLRSPHYADQQERYQQGGAFPVFDRRYTWRFAPAR